MNLKLLFLSLFGSLSFISCQQAKKQVSFSDYKIQPLEDVYVKVSKNEVFILDLIHLETKSRLRSKTTTIFYSNLFYSTTETVEGKNLVLKYTEHTSIPKYLKSQLDRKPFLEDINNQLMTKKYTVENFRYQFYKGEIPQNLEGSFVMEVVYD